MLRSLFSGVTGMKSNQVKMDVIGNNIANVNTTGFKAGRVTFKDMLSQTIQTANAPSQGRGGMNPKQVGLGVAVAGIDTNMSQGGLQPTSRATDMAIEGNGFYIVSDGNETRYTRDGAFTLDKQGNLITADGYHIMGIINGNIPTVENGKKLFYAGADDSNQKFKDIAKNTPSTLKDIVIPLEAVKSVSLGGFNISLNPDTSFEGYKFVLGTVADGTAASAAVNNTDKVITINGDFTANGGMISAADLQGAIATALGASETVTVGGLAKETASGATSGLITKGLETLTSFGIETDGSIQAVYGDKTVKVGQIALGAFQNAAGLTKMGGNSYVESLNSGSALVGSAATSGYGNIQQGMLEMSNVDLASEFTDMIVTSRAFQANSRTITTSDEMLQELLNLKR